MTVRTLLQRLESKRPVKACCRGGKNRVVDPESFRPRKQYGQPATC